jgi:hypothetical protein
LGLCLVLLLATPGRAAEPLASFRKSVARKVRAEAQKNVSKKCFLTARCILDLGLALVPADQGVAKLLDAIRFAPAVPLSVVHRGCRSADLPTSTEMTQQNHQLLTDADCLKAFWEKTRDSMLVSFLRLLQGPARKPDLRSLAGKFAFVIRNLSKQTPSWGRKTAFDTANKLLTKLGYKVDGRTGKSISPEQIAFWEERDKVTAEKLKALQGGGLAVETIDARSEFEDNIGIALQKARSDHFHIEASFTPGDAKLALAMLEETYRLFAKKMKVPPQGRMSNPLRVVVLPGQQEFGVYIDMMTSESSERREFLKKSTGAHPVPHKGLFVVFDHLTASGTPFAHPSLVPLRDKMISMAVENIAYAFGFHWFPQWVRFGLGSWFSLEVLSTADTGRISMQETTGIEQTEWYNYLRWRELMKRAAARGADPGTGSLLARDNANEINWTHRAKMFSLVDYFIERDVAAFKTYLTSVGNDWKSWRREGDGEFLPLKRAGYPMKRLDKSWRTFVSERY